MRKTVAVQDPEVLAELQARKDLLKKAREGTISVADIKGFADAGYSLLHCVEPETNISLLHKVAYASPPNPALVYELICLCPDLIPLMVQKGGKLNGATALKLVNMHLAPKRVKKSALNLPQSVGNQARLKRKRATFQGDLNQRQVIRLLLETGNGVVETLPTIGSAGTELPLVSPRAFIELANRVYYETSGALGGDNWRTASNHIQFSALMLEMVKSTSRVRDVRALRLAEIGGGQGTFAKWLRDEFGTRVHNFEFSSSLQAAQSATSASGESFVVPMGNLTQPGAIDPSYYGVYDGVCFNEIADDIFRWELTFQGAEKTPCVSYFDLNGRRQFVPIDALPDDHPLARHLIENPLTDSKGPKYICTLMPIVLENVRCLLKPGGHVYMTDYCTTTHGPTMRLYATDFGKGKDVQSQMEQLLAPSMCVTNPAERGDSAERSAQRFNELHVGLQNCTWTVDPAPIVALMPGGSGPISLKDWADGHGFWSNYKDMLFSKIRKARTAGEIIAAISTFCNKEPGKVLIERVGLGLRMLESKCTPEQAVEILKINTLQSLGEHPYIYDMTGNSALKGQMESIEVLVLPKG